jgi:adenylosuccinate lyase
MRRNRQRLQREFDGIAFGKLSGAVGVYAHLDPAFEKSVMKRLGLGVEPVSTQVVPRDCHAELYSSLAVLGGGMERIGIEICHLQRSEVGELKEGFSKIQKGLSAMPHKRNPVSSENITGCARMLRGYAVSRRAGVVPALEVDRDRVRANLDTAGLELPTRKPDDPKKWGCCSEAEILPRDFLLVF